MLTRRKMQLEGAGMPIVAFDVQVADDPTEGDEPKGLVETVAVTV